jgi:CRP/FNR family cyclic AMP-dependent transcriptional regulator
VSGSMPVNRGFLDMLDRDDRSALIRLGHPRRYRRGAFVVVQGDHSDSVFVLLEGWVKVTVGTASGREFVLAVLGRGDVLGEFEAIDRDGGPRSAGVVALAPVEGRALTAGEFHHFLESHPRASLVLLSAIIHRLRAADRRRIDSGSLDITHRLARFLVELTDQYGDAGTSGITIDLPLTQEELAGLIAASRESVVRALSALRSRGLIATGRRRITIRDPDGLQQYAT